MLSLSILPVSAKMVTAEENTDGCKEMLTADDDEDIPPNQEMEMGDSEDALQLQGKTVNENKNVAINESKDQGSEDSSENNNGEDEHGSVSEDEQLNRLLHECDPSHTPGILIYIGVSSQ